MHVYPLFSATPTQRPQSMVRRQPVRFGTWADDAKAHAYFTLQPHHLQADAVLKPGISTYPSLTSEQLTKAANIFKQYKCVVFPNPAEVLRGRVREDQLIHWARAMMYQVTWDLGQHIRHNSSEVLQLGSHDDFTPDVFVSSFPHGIAPHHDAPDDKGILRALGYAPCNEQVTHGGDFVIWNTQGFLQERRIPTVIGKRAGIPGDPTELDSYILEHWEKEMEQAGYKLVLNDLDRKNHPFVVFLDGPKTTAHSVENVSIKHGVKNDIQRPVAGIYLRPYNTQDEFPCRLIGYGDSIPAVILNQQKKLVGFPPGS